MTDHSADPDTVLFQRYRDPGFARPAQWNATLDVLMAHRSVRRFTDAPVSDETLATLVAAAQSASTSSNLQLWSVVAVRDPARKARLAGFCGNQRHIVEAPLFLVWLADFARLRQLAEDHGKPLDGQDFLEAGVLGCVDAALAAQNAVVAAESLGLGTVYIGAIRNRPEDVVHELALPRYAMPVFGMCVGRPDPSLSFDVKPRLPQRAVLHHETYDLPAQREEVARYEERVNAFYGEQAMAESWVARVLARMASGQSLTGRHRLREAWHNQGYELK
ncbi:NADPH-dependent oxidoreductase [Verticiella sediminum]|uniref:NADPH-dependent oxidoreductase n=1 Tax=Verticiella sediminum TaxID=1247510 RepID=A0A556AG86_9BURK|nr:NADPH-dependent oxidoreductase [Verticiella sediminum]TSH91899.1 NADPH-dependent oxidoreductase [Verticiella sediminum]